MPAAHKTQTANGTVRRIETETETQATRTLITVDAQPKGVRMVPFN